jgi:hypothetical protein
MHDVARGVDQGMRRTVLATHPYLRQLLLRLARPVSIASKKFLVDQYLFFVLWCAPKVATT